MFGLIGVSISFLGPLAALAVFTLATARYTVRIPEMRQNARYVDALNHLHTPDLHRHSDQTENTIFLLARRACLRCFFGTC